MQYMDKKVMV